MAAALVLVHGGRVLLGAIRASSAQIREQGLKTPLTNALTDSFNPLLGDRLRDDLSRVTFYPPDFSKHLLAPAPDARFVPAPADGVLPEGFFSSTNLPTYVRVSGEWRMPREPRMDSVLILDRGDVLWTREPR